MILKYFTISILLISTLCASTINKKIIAFEKNRIATNDNRIQVEKVTVIHKESIKSMNGWHGYILDIKLKVNGKSINAKDILFSDGKLITAEIQNINTGESIKDSVIPLLSRVYYNNAHLITGNSNAKNKIVIFSDPLSKESKEILPSIIKHVRKNKKKISLYYYHFPLLKKRPASDVISRATIIAKNKKIRKVDIKVYETDFSKYFEPTERDADKILKAFNKELKTNITLAEISDEKIGTRILNDIQMGDSVFVNSTPAVFINGKRDRTLKKYKKIGK